MLQDSRHKGENPNLFCVFHSEGSCEPLKSTL